LAVVDPEGTIDDALNAATTASAPSPPARIEDTVTVAVHSRVDDRGELNRVRAHDRTPTTDELELPLSAVLAPGAADEHVHDVSVPLSERRRADTLTARRPGISPLTVTVGVAGAELAELTTMMQVLPEQPSDDPSLGIAVTAALTEPGPDPDADARGVA